VRRAVRAAVVAELGHEPDGLDAAIDRVLGRSRWAPVTDRRRSPGRPRLSSSRLVAEQRPVDVSSVQVLAQPPPGWPGEAGLVPGVLPGLLYDRFGW